ncbi:MAG: site-specific DNA-methyltransferase [Pyrinomonadaceae bacterium]
MNDNKTWENLEPTFSLVEDRLRILKQALPEAFTDGKINFDTLKELLGASVADEEQDEHFGLSWTGKREARKLAGMPSKGTLVPVKGKGLHEETTENIFIEGDNLEVLKLLHKSYYGKIKMIYIDPPYNTGNDFIYKDDYKMPLESYLQRSGQMNEMDEMLTSNPKSSGRFHSDWLNMLYPRLRVAKDLLGDDGVIFVSIDDNEVHNLRQMMNEIFGEENFIANLIWRARSGKSGTIGFISEQHEHILLYCKSNEKLKLRLNENKREGGSFQDSKGNYNREPLMQWGQGDRREDRPSMFFGIPNETNEVFPIKEDGSEGRWRYGKEKVFEMLENDNLDFVLSNDRWIAYRKIRDGQVSYSATDSILESVGTASNGTIELKSLFDGKKIFDTSKPLGLLTYIINLVLFESKEGIFLDFFAGSGTTAQSVMELNKDGANRKFICVQIDEKIIDDKSEAFRADFRKISEITAERIRRASKKIEKELGAGLPLEQKPDLGFKFYRLERSNFKAWSDYQGTDLDELRGLLQEQVSTSFVEGATKEAILTEILLLEGFPLDSDISQDELFERNTVWRVSSEFSEHRLFVTLDDEIWEETISTAEELEANDIFICLDKALSDESKIRMSDVCRLKVI